MSAQPDMTPCELQVLAVSHCTLCHEDVMTVAPTKTLAGAELLSMMQRHHLYNHAGDTHCRFTVEPYRVVLKEIA